MNREKLVAALNKYMEARTPEDHKEILQAATAYLHLTDMFKKMMPEEGKKK